MTYRLKYLTGKRLEVFLAAADVIIPPDGTGPGGGTMATAGVADWSLGRMPEALRKKFLLLLVVLRVLGLFFGLKFFQNLSDEKKIRVLAWMESAPIGLFRMGFFGLKNFVCMGYYTREDIWRAIGYDGPVHPDVAFSDPAIRDLCTGLAEVVQ